MKKKPRDMLFTHTVVKSGGVTETPRALNTISDPFSYEGRGSKPINIVEGMSLTKELWTRHHQDAQ